jgi:hypothetical protein
MYSLEILRSFSIEDKHFFRPIISMFLPLALYGTTRIAAETAWHW